MDKWTWSCKHKDTGTLWLISGVWSGMIGTSLSMIIRSELGQPGSLLGNDQIYKVVVTAHAFIMIFFIVMPILVGSMGNSLMSFIFGYRTMASSRLNSLTFLFLLPALTMLLLSSIMESMDSITISFYLTMVSLLLGTMNCISPLINSWSLGALLASSMLGFIAWMVFSYEDTTKLFSVWPQMPNPDIKFISYMSLTDPTGIYGGLKNILGNTFPPNIMASDYTGIYGPLKFPCPKCLHYH